ncbi:hypothetical protein [Stenotrophomonas sp. YAU14D1_LEIMI4_1]|uniref:hypothetical protein n=1 Tax=Stenotrophomonas sp. YAU14D1_LEIMI4_1 TaxID=2072407 RepID=UPI000D53C9B4|nr:hypothetical protein [Stenotrophomonas sp. YAU14D1_LEIMI4_1]AWH25768.1 hypothetical protein C1932_12050 [Stenotrophomonas sp. YAU14D1_LEIMI4_1]
MSNDKRSTGHNLDTSEGARAYVAEYFANQVGRHDFRAYITTRLAADFACALATHLAAQPFPAGQVDAMQQRDAARYRWLRDFIDQSPQAIEHLACSDGDLIDDVIDAAMGAAALAAPPAQAVDLPYSLNADPAGIRARVCDVIAGTLMVGAQGHTPPPAGHWAEPFWNAARADAAAQAVDLGQFRECVELMEWQERGHANPEWPTGSPEKHAEALRLLALIDSQVVRNV